jgi:hypothetical protein
MSILIPPSIGSQNNRYSRATPAKRFLPNPDEGTPESILLLLKTLPVLSYLGIHVIPSTLKVRIQLLDVTTY